MSMTITVQGVYNNNKKATVGTHNPQNNRFFNESEKEHLEKMILEHLIPKHRKFKSIRIIMHNDGREISNGEYYVSDMIAYTYNMKAYVNELMELFKFYSNK